MGITHNLSQGFICIEVLILEAFAEDLRAAEQCGYRETKLGLKTRLAFQINQLNC